MRLSSLNEARVTKYPQLPMRQAATSCIVCTKEISPVLIKGRYGPNYERTKRMEIPDKFTLDGYLVDELVTGEPLVQMSRVLIDDYSELTVCSELCAEALIVYKKAAHDPELKKLVDIFKPKMWWYKQIISCGHLSTPQKAAEFKTGLERIGYIVSPIMVHFNDDRTNYLYGVCILPVEGFGCQRLEMWYYKPDYAGYVGEV